jgi:hypothetical protein
MNTSSRVPGLSRNSGWQVIDAQIADQRRRQQQQERLPSAASLPGLGPSADCGTPEYLHTPSG